MIPNLLYKYISANSGLEMLKNHNLQFTNATMLNDPFDCHHKLIDFSNVPKEKCKIWSAEVISKLESYQYENLRKQAWVCSLSKTYNKLLMWCFYSGYDGICIGIDKEKTKQYFSKILNEVYIGTQEMEVQYKDLKDKPVFFRNYGITNLFQYQLSTKAKDWEYEQEVRLLLINPILDPQLLFVPEEQRKNDPIAVEEVRFRPPIGGECFNELYLGVQTNKDKQEEIIDVARSLNPEIKIFKMKEDTDAFRLNALPFCEKK